MNHSSAKQEIVIQPRSALGRLGLTEVWEYQHLLRYFVLRALRTRYRPTRLGYVWILGRPILLCIAYVLVVGFLFKVDTHPVPFPLFVFLGVALFLFFSGGVMDTMTSLINNASIISRVYYPRLIVPLTSIISNFLDLVAALVVVAAMMALYRVTPSVNVVWLPLFLAGFVGATFALGVIGAARTVNVRDWLLVMPSAMRVLIYTMPCVYPISLVPERFRDFYYLNPLAVYVQGIRWTLWNEVAPPVWSIVLASAVVTVAIVYGLYSFNRVERRMVDTL
jgi:lipopolysaccharide transport system permease protein